MALVIETGLLIANATSYVSVEEVRAYAEARGIEIPADDASIEQAAIRAMDVIEAKSYKGRPTYSAQPTAFPRYGIYLPGYSIPLPYDAVPAGVKKAQIEYTIAIANGFDLLPTLDGAPVKREKIGPIETEYVVGTAQGSAPVVQAAEAALRPFQRYGLTTVRV